MRKISEIFLKFRNEKKNIMTYDKSLKVKDKSKSILKIQAIFNIFF